MLRNVNCLEITCLYTRGHKETFGGDEYVYRIVMMVTWVYMYFQTQQIVFINIVQFSVYKLYINKAGKTGNNSFRNVPGI